MAQETYLQIEYYNRPFKLLFEALPKETFNGISHFRKHFWSLVPEDRYDYLNGKGLFHSYLHSVTNKIEEIVSRYSRAYWLHLSRRIHPFSVGDDEAPQTILAVRTTLNAAIQKFGASHFCEHVGKSKEINLSEILGGLLLIEKFNLERHAIDAFPNQLVLTKFTHLNIEEFYILEKLCYEYWYSLAKMRALQKGAFIKIDHSLPEMIVEYRTDELAKLIESFDSRHEDFISSTTGTVFTSQNEDVNSDTLIPVLNVRNETIESFNPVFEKIFRVSLNHQLQPNYFLYPISLSSYLRAHQPFTDDFKSKHNISFQAILLVISTLCTHYFHLSKEGKAGVLFTIIQRAYQGPSDLRDIRMVCSSYKKVCEKILGIDAVSDAEIDSAIAFLTLQDPTKIRLSYAGTLKMFIPVEDQKVYIDFSIIVELLNNLFFDIDLNKFSFRGQTLEIAVNENKSYLPTSPCKSVTGESRQVDFSVRLGDHLIIGECKVVAWSLGMYTGEKSALNYRIDRVLNKGLHEVDEKANWLCQNPLGRNYDLSGISYIVPLVISPFKEFIPSLNTYYWLNQLTPRVLTSSELKTFLIEFDKEYYNKKLLPTQA